MFGQDKPLNVAQNALPIALTADDVITHDHCPVCGGGHLSPYEELVFRGIVIPYHRCLSCDLVFMNPVPNQAWYDRLYSQAFWETKSAEGIDDEYLVRQGQLIKELQRTDKLCATLDVVDCAPPAGGQILEIGCAFGLIVSGMAENYKAHAFGVEPSELAARFANTLGGVQIVASTVEQLNEMVPGPGDQIDLMLFSHVMENVVDLDIVFAALDRWLAPNGVVLMETPNSTVQNSTHIYHPYCFSRTSLQQLYGSHGYDILFLRASGRPSSAMIPRYLTLVARRKLGARVPRMQISKGRARRLGHGWRKFIKGTPLKYVDRILTGFLYAPSDTTKQRAAELATAYYTSGETTRR